VELTIPAALMTTGATLEQTATNLVRQQWEKPMPYLDTRQVRSWLTAHDGRSTLTVAYLGIASPPAEVSGALWVPAHTGTQDLLSCDDMAVLAAAIDRLKRILSRTTVGRFFLTETFSVADLRRVYEAVWQCRLDPGDFQKAVLCRDGFLADSGLRRFDRPGAATAPLHPRRRRASQLTPASGRFP
jgi:8-oxo-dGTP diphosphatase